MNKIRIILFAVLFLSLLTGALLRTEGKVDEFPYLDEVAPGEVFGQKGGSPSHYTSLNGVAAFNSYDVSPSIRGYAGPIKMLVALSPGGSITGLRVLEHKETPNYVHSMDKPEFLGQFIGKSVNDPLVLDGDIDGISRATVSVKALTDTVRESSRLVASQAMGMEVRGSANGGGAGQSWAAYTGLFVAAMALYFITRRPLLGRRLQRLRDASLILGVLVIGLWLSSPFSILHVMNALLLRVPTDALILAILASVLFSAAVAGRFYCGWLCPFGAISEFLGRLPVRKWEVLPDTDSKWRNVKYYLLGMVFAAVLISGRIGYGNFETYVTLFSFHGNALTWGIVALSLLVSLRVRRFWCRYLCPVGALGGLLSRRDAIYVSSPDCPMSNRRDPLGSECVRCNRCCSRQPEGR